MIHVDNCEKKWVKKEETKPPRERRPVPERPALLGEPLPKTAAGVESFNAAMFEAFNSASLIRCSGCGRTFNEEALARHAKGCQGGAGAAGAGGAGGGDLTGGGGFNQSMGKGPKAYTCYVCGAGFMAGSLLIHVEQCEEKRRLSDDRPLGPRPAEYGQPLPTRAAEIEEFNNKMGDVFNRVTMVACGGCGRTFKDADTMARHARGCAGAAKDVSASVEGLSLGGGGGVSGGGASAGGPSRAPKSYVCYLCGRQFGSSSLGIHIPKCLDKWAAREAAKAPGERRAPPVPPAELEDPLPTRAADVEAFNERMSQVYNTASLVRCDSCGRTFNEEAHARHVKSCRGR